MHTNLGNKPLKSKCPIFINSTFGFICLENYTFNEEHTDTLSQMCHGLKIKSNKETEM